MQKISHSDLKDNPHNISENNSMQILPSSRRRFRHFKAFSKTLFIVVSMVALVLVFQQLSMKPVGVSVVELENLHMHDWSARLAQIADDGTNGETNDKAEGDEDDETASQTDIKEDEVVHDYESQSGDDEEMAGMEDMTKDADGENDGTDDRKVDADYEQEHTDDENGDADNEKKDADEKEGANDKEYADVKEDPEYEIDDTNNKNDDTDDENKDKEVKRNTKTKDGEKEDADVRTKDTDKKEDGFAGKDENMVKVDLVKDLVGHKDTDNSRRHETKASVGNLEQGKKSGNVGTDGDSTREGSMTNTEKTRNQVSLKLAPQHHSEIPAKSHLSTFARAVQKIAVNNTIVISVLDNAYLHLAINLIITSFKPHGITNYIFICLSKEAQMGMAKFGVPCLVHEVLTENNKPSVFGSKAFIEKTLIKPLYVLEALKLNYDVMLVDLDIVFFKNPFHYLDCYDYDLCIQLDSVNKNRVNSGFYLVHPTKAGIAVHQKSMDMLGSDPTTRVQQAMQDLLLEMHHNKEIKTKLLDVYIYPSGKIYFEVGQRMFRGDNPCRDCVLVHNNWIRFEEAKVYRMKETGLWSVDVNGYYSDPHRKYLMYTNPLEVGNLTASLEKNALQVALFFGKLLNRTVILPSFTCHGCDITICDPKRRHCSMNTQFFIPDFDKYFSGKYRESCFLQHEMVPKSVKQSVSRLLHVDTSDILVKFAQEFRLPSTARILPKLPRGTKVFTPRDSSLGATSDEIVRWFSTSMLNDFSVLNFHAMYFALTSLSDKHRDSVFERMLTSGLTGGDYRQNIKKHKFFEFNKSPKMFYW